MAVRKTKFYEDGFYHIFNRGVEKRDIFLDVEDYKTFLSIINNYLSSNKPTQGPALRVRGHKFHEEIKLLAYCLMPNHFHFLVQQKLFNSITNFMQRFLTAYSMYFNEKYDRVGSLFQGRFKAIDVETDEYLLHLSRYIHRNPLEANLTTVDELQKYPWSSYTFYLGKNEVGSVYPRVVLDYFSSKGASNDYQKFVEFEAETAKLLPKNLLIE